MHFLFIDSENNLYVIHVGPTILDVYHDYKFIGNFLIKINYDKEKYIDWSTIYPPSGYVTLINQELRSFAERTIKLLAFS